MVVGLATGTQVSPDRAFEAPPSPAQADQPIALPSSNTPPVGPSAGNRTPHSTLAAPCATERGALRPPMSVRTHPGLTAFTRIPFVDSSLANRRASASS